MESAKISSDSLPGLMLGKASFCSCTHWGKSFMAIDNSGTALSITGASTVGPITKTTAARRIKPNKDLKNIFIIN